MEYDLKRAHESVREAYLGYRTMGLGINQALQLVALGLQAYVAASPREDVTVSIPAIVPMGEGDLPWDLVHNRPAQPQETSGPSS